MSLCVHIKSRTQVGFPLFSLCYPLLSSLTWRENEQPTSPRPNPTDTTKPHRYASSISSRSHLESKFRILWRTNVDSETLIVFDSTFAALSLTSTFDTGLQLTYNRIFRPIKMMEEIDFELCLGVEKHVSLMGSAHALIFTDMFVFEVPSGHCSS